MRVRIAVVAGIAIALTIASACGDDEADTSTEAPTPTEASESEVARAPVAPPEVVVVSLTPVEGEEATGGSCGPSIALNRPDAWRCFAGSRVFDPCFSEEDVDDEVVCMISSPWEAKGALVSLDEPLRERLDGVHASKVWGIELADGSRCSWMGGATTTIEGARLNYSCGEDWFIVGLSRVEPPWIARKVLLEIPLSAPHEPLESQDVPIVRIWR